MSLKIAGVDLILRSEPNNLPRKTIAKAVSSLWHSISLHAAFLALPLPGITLVRLLGPVSVHVPM
jgi:hypothetical protein